MCPNRVEELESRVQELEASVRGLTDELVECKVRLRELEDAEAEDDLLQRAADETQESTAEAETAPETAPEPDPTPEDETASVAGTNDTDEGRVAGPADDESQSLTDGAEVMADREADEAPNTGDDEPEDDTEDSGNDIIIA